MTGSVCCCARAANGSVAAEPAITLMKSRRLIVAPDTQGAAWPPFAVQYKKIINTDWSIRNANAPSFYDSDGSPYNVRFGSLVDIPLSLHDVRFSRHASGPWRNSKRIGLIKKMSSTAQWCQSEKKECFSFRDLWFVIRRRKQRALALGNILWPREKTGTGRLVSRPACRGDRTCKSSGFTLERAR